MNSIARFGKPALALLLTLGLVAPLAAIAKDDGCKAERHQKDGMAPDFRQMKMMVKKLDLSEKQQAQFDALRAEMKAAREADKGKIKAQRESFHNLIVANASEAELKAQADQLAQGMSDKMVQMSLHMQAFRAILTPEQLAKMDAMKAERDAKRSKGEEKHSQKE